MPLRAEFDFVRNKPIYYYIFNPVIAANIIIFTKPIFMRNDLIVFIYYHTFNRIRKWNKYVVE